MSFPRHRFPFCASGFTLIEMAIVLLILTLVIGSSLVPLSAQIDQRQRAETQRTLDEIKEALIGYTLAHNVLPCPSMVSAGIPNGTAITLGNCGLTSASIATGYIPWVTLGVNNKDAWNNLIRYAVSIKFTDPSNPFTLDTSSLNSSNTITIQTRDNSGAIVTLSSTIPAVVFSQGKNGYGALSADYIPQSSIPTGNPDEQQNATTNSGQYVSRTPSPAGTSSTLGGEFDDLVVWISPNILFNRMVAAGKLP